MLCRRGWGGRCAHLLFTKYLGEKIPPVIYGLMELETLVIVDCPELTVIDEDIRKLKHLSLLVGQHCPKLASITPAISQLTDLQLRFSDVGLVSPPPEIVNQGIDAVRNYFESVDESRGLDYLYEAKMVLVGRGFSGKTSLVRKLTNPSYHLEENIPSTEGIAIDTWDMEMPLQKSDRFRFNIWDFGGQEKYDATHQFFITERTIYLFVTEATQESSYLDFDYYLNIVQMLGNNSPVIVVQNKIDLRKKSLPSKKALPGF